MMILNRKQIIGYTSLITVATFFTGALNFLFNMVVGRLIGPEEYGILSPLMGSFFSVLSVPMMGFQLFMNQSLGELISHHPEGIRSFIRFVFLNLIKLLLGLEVILWLLLPVWQMWFKLSGGMILGLVFVMVLVNYIQIFIYTILQFRHEFGVIFWVTIITTLIKFFLGLGLAWWFRTALAVVFAYFVPLVVSTLVYTLFLWKWYVQLPHEDFRSPPHFWKSLVVSMLSGGAYVVLSSFDVLLVRVFFADQTLVGVYAMAGLIARASFFVASAFTTVFLPVMAKQKEKSLNLTMWGLVVLCGILLCYVGGVWVFRFFIAYVLLGGMYPRLEHYVAPYTLLFVPYALISFLVSFYTVKRSLFYSVMILLGVVMQWFFFSFWHESLWQALAIVGGVGWGLLGLFLGELILRRRKDEVL